MRDHGATSLFARRCSCLHARCRRTTRRYVHTFGYGAIGLGMGAAVGAAVADPRPVLFAVGDGGFMNGGLVEFNTAVRYGLDITVIVLNDGSYGAEFQQFAARGALAPRGGRARPHT